VRTVVVTGIAGSLGQRVSSRLAGRPDVERVVGIDVVPPDWTHPKLDVRLVDLAAPAGPNDPLLPVLERVGAVIHLAWRVPGERSGAAEANRRALDRVLTASAAAGTGALVHLSSATVYGAWADNKVPLTEDTPLRPNPEFSFAVGKAEAERALAEWSEDHPEVAVAVLRPAVTVGSPEQPLYEALGATKAPKSGDGHRPVQYLHVDDLAEAVVLAWDQQLRGVYNVAPDTGLEEEDARVLAGGVARVALPARLANAVSAWGWNLWRRGLPAEARAYTTHPWVVAPDRLKAAGWQPHYSSEEALVATDVRPHWDDLPPGRRQNYNLLIAVAAVVAAAGGIAGGVAAWRVKRRRRS
jgi:nucleoside-diphosphate-sugar epimerase